MPATYFAQLTSAPASRYRIERELAVGGMATVYFAHDLKHDREVALKVLEPELAAVLGGDRFVVEIKTTANLRHPHIQPLFDSGAANACLYDVMPYVEAETLLCANPDPPVAPPRDSVVAERKALGRSSRP